MEYFDNTLPILQFFEHKINLNQVYQFTAICRADPPNIFVLFHYKRKLHFFILGPVDYFAVDQKGTLNKIFCNKCFSSNTTLKHNIECISILMTDITCHESLKVQHLPRHRK